MSFSARLSKYIVVVVVAPSERCSRFILIQVSNHTTLPMMIVDVESIERRSDRQVCRIDPAEECFLPILPLYSRSSSRLFLAFVDETTEEISDFISFDWREEVNVDRILKNRSGEEIHLVVSMCILSSPLPHLSACVCVCLGFRSQKKRSTPTPRIPTSPVESVFICTSTCLSICSIFYPSTFNVRSMSVESEADEMASMDSL